MPSIQGQVLQSYISSSDRSIPFRASPLLSQQGDQIAIHCMHSFFDARRVRYAGRARWAKRGEPGGFPTARIERPSSI